MAFNKDNASIISSGTLSAKDLEECFSRIRSKPQNIGGKNAYVLSKSFMDKLEDTVLEKMEGTSSMSPNKLIELNDELQKLRKLNEQLVQERTAATGALAAKKKDLDGLQEAIRANEIVNERQFAEMKSLLQVSESSLKDASAEVKHFKELLKTARTTASDPDVVKGLSDKLKDAEEIVTQCKRDINAYQGEISHKNSELSKLKSRLDELNKAKRLDEKIVYGTKVVDSEDFLKEPIEANKLEIQNKFLSKLIGPKSIAWMTQFDATMRNDVRNRAYFLMLSTKASKDVTVVGVHKLLEFVYQWVKKQAMKVRGKVTPFIDKIASDLKNNCLQALSFYRDLLASIVEEYKTEISNIKKGKSKQDDSKYKFQYEYTWSSVPYVWSQIAYRRLIKRPAKRIASFTEKIFGKISKFFSGWKTQPDNVVGEPIPHINLEKEVTAPEVQDESVLPRKKLVRKGFKLFG